MLAQREHDYFAETVICANCYIVAKIFGSNIPVVTKCSFHKYTIKFREHLFAMFTEFSNFASV